jgi:hypothetical protein
MIGIHAAAMAGGAGVKRQNCHHLLSGTLRLARPRDIKCRSPEPTALRCSSASLPRTFLGDGPADTKGAGA